MPAQWSSVEVSQVLLDLVAILAERLVGLLRYFDLRNRRRMAAAAYEPNDHKRAERKRRIWHRPAEGVRVGAVDFRAVFLRERVGNGFIGEPGLLHLPDLGARRFAEAALPGRHHAVGIIGAASALAGNVPGHTSNFIARNLRLRLRETKPCSHERQQATFPPSHTSS